VRYDRLKRALDGLAATLGLLILSPVLLIVATVVATTLGRPVLFRQARPGLHGRPFTLIKFRTMRPDTTGQGPATDGARLTTVGRVLRATSLDELPTLWNVLRGEMSVVGPRPLLMQYIERYSPEQARRHDVRPGITGLAQARGRNALSWDDKFALDVEYVRRQSFVLDLRILAATVRTVLRRDGIAAEGQATVLEFRGTMSRHG
jgi:lipopolysaccharide/colanic/teichoic acid biosynthesis glycosyltransferase